MDTYKNMYTDITKHNMVKALINKTLWSCGSRIAGQLFDQDHHSLKKFDSWGTKENFDLFLWTEEHSIVAQKATIQTKSKGMPQITYNAVCLFKCSLFANAFHTC